MKESFISRRGRGGRRDCILRGCNGLAARDVWMREGLLSIS